MAAAGGAAGAWCWMEILGGNTFQIEDHRLQGGIDLEFPTIPSKGIL